MKPCKSRNGFFFFFLFGSAQPGALGVGRDINSDGKFMAESFSRDLFIFHKIFFYHYENVFHRLQRASLIEFILGMFLFDGSCVELAVGEAAGGFFLRFVIGCSYRTTAFR